MALSEKRILKSVEVFPNDGVAQVCWANQVLSGTEVLVETLERRAYIASERAVFEADVEGGVNYITALGWNK